MKNILLLTFVILMMVGCNSPTHNIEAPLGGNIAITGFSTIIVDSCEYIEGFNRLAHKGNCRFCTERRKEELKELYVELTKGE